MSGAPLAAAAERLYEAAWEFRRLLYARGVRRPERVRARVVSLGNLSVGGTGKTTLALHLAARASERGTACAVVCRRYRPGPGDAGDEELLLRERLPGTPVFAGDSKRELARAAAASGAALVLVDDAFSHWRLARDCDLVLVDGADPLGGGRLLPAGRLREPLRALQRADAVIVTRLAPGAAPDDAFATVAPYAPAALLAAGRHEIVGAFDSHGAPLPAGAPVFVVTATGNPGAVRASAAEAGLDVRGARTFRDHHWFSAGEVREVLAAARPLGARVLLTAKDAVRWPRAAREDAAVLEVRWRWVASGEAVERLAFGGAA